MLVKYMIRIPIPNPDNIDALENNFSPSCRIQFIMETTTWNIAPAPMDKNTTAANGE